MTVDYANSLLALTASVLTHYGAHTAHKTLPELDRLLEKSYKNVVVMLFDGMGTAILNKHLPADSFLRRHFTRSISSVFPPTTTAATITMETGLSPIEHGWLGWSLYFDELGQNVSVFPNTLSGTNGEPAADYNVARRYLSYKSMYEKIEAATKGEVNAYCVSPFSSFKSQSVREICDTVEKLCAKDHQKYMYTYWPQPDYDMHEYGTTHERVKNLVRDIDAAVEALCARLQDTLVVVTADHGLIDTRWFFLPEYPDILACLTRMPSIETRASAFFVKPDMHEQFENAFKEHFGHHFKLLTKRQALEENLFGEGSPHARAEGFLGDYIAIATGEYGVDCSAPHTDAFKAAHAGMTVDEMNVPFIVVRCGEGV